MLISDPHALCRLRSTLEAFAVEHTQKDRPALYALLDAEVAAMERAAQRADYPAFHQHDLAFHRHLIDSVELLPLRQSWDLVMSDLDEWLQNVKRDYWPNLITLHQEHLLLLEALRSPVQKIRANALHQHLEAGWHRIALSGGLTPDSLDPVAKANAFLSTHFASHVEMEFVARNIAFISLSHLNRLFRKHAGISPYARLRQIRIDHAAELLLSTDDPIANIAPLSGYRNLSHFTRDFRILKGETPARFRKKMLQREMI